MAPDVRHAARLLISLVLLLGTVAGCASPTESSPEARATRPAIPHLWRTVTNDEGTLRLAVPGELSVTMTAGGIGGFMDRAAGGGTLDVWAAPPEETPPRAADQAILAWLDENALIPVPSAEIERGPVTERDVRLPAGPAREVSAGFSGSDTLTWVIAYVIATDRGPGLVRFIGMAGQPDAFASEIRVMRELVEFGPPFEGG